jgi:hypothetical protein
MPSILTERVESLHLVCLARRTSGQVLECSDLPKMPGSNAHELTGLICDLDELDVN